MRPHTSEFIGAAIVLAVLGGRLIYALIIALLRHF